ncbi:hypothetical protein DBV23_00985 [Edwardsiella ictaluri]|uniref:Iso-IS1 ORF2 n=1 Tax=Edwardsiella ictaluri (strain 93-146) TaxID=634503 RepID=C5B7X2_EDWI9|nr:iso-IS1 ORF2 [Edwardsiella ictaluri 93-146]AVZ81030.1 hypothetical protein DBV23_00985 [Edwardsiella ictaluri]EKS7764638.1 hypothetical protein [Edwardsiella ictaluri]EKS7771636.1 hypothetical protein [Edwardsiella ictaluri]EKS7774816.1 hypothetical protein [Edwardsiella ictaluri]
MWLTAFNIGMITRDDWGNPIREVPWGKPLTGTIFTQHSERNSLMLRTRIKRLARKRIGFSRAIALHEKVTGALSKSLCPTHRRRYRPEYATGVGGIGHK